MSRSLLFVLLLATGVVLADDAPETKPAASVTKAQAQTEEDTCVVPADHVPGAETLCRKAQAQTEKAAKQAEDDEKLLSGMSVLGNQEAPKALVIVPWKSSEIGSALGISTVLDDSRQPIDKEVFMRMLSYYEVRSKTTRHDGAQPATAAHRR